MNKIYFRMIGNVYFGPKPMITHGYFREKRLPKS